MTKAAQKFDGVEIRGKRCRADKAFTSEPPLLAIVGPADPVHDLTWEYLRIDRVLRAGKLAADNAAKVRTKTWLRRGTKPWHADPDKVPEFSEHTRIMTTAVVDVPLLEASGEPSWSEPFPLTCPHCGNAAKLSGLVGAARSAAMSGEGHQRRLNARQSH